MKKKFFLAALILFSCLTPVKFSVWAYTPGSYTNTTNTSIYNPILPVRLQEISGVDFFQKALNVAVSWGFIIGGLVFFFIFVMGAIRWITAGGDKAASESAHKTITNAIVGLIILFSIFAIINLIEVIFGINILKFPFPTL